MVCACRASSALISPTKRRRHAIVGTVREAIVPFAATTILAFVVHRWLGDELERERRLSSAAASAALALFLLHGLLVAISALAGVLPFGLPPALAASVGVVLILGGGGLAIAALRAFGSRERFLAIRIDKVVQSGPYRFARHPFYLGWVVALLGLAVAGRSALALGLVALLTLALIRIASGEERLLSAELGDAYDDYRRQAPAIAGKRRLATPTA